MPNLVEIFEKCYEIKKFVAPKYFSLKSDKRVAPNKAMLEGKLSLELISVQHVY